jgi:hypothetical protein
VIKNDTTLNEPNDFFAFFVTKSATWDFDGSAWEDRDA